MSTPLLATILVVIACITLIVRELLETERARMQLRETARINREYAERKLESIRVSHYYTMREIEARRTMHQEWHEGQRNLKDGDEPWRG